jgi:hypothetical protein
LSNQLQRGLNKHPKLKPKLINDKRNSKMILKVMAASKALLATSFMSLAGGQSNYTFSTVPVVDGSANTIQEVAHDSTISNTLIISYSTVAALAEIDAVIAKQKKQGKKVLVKGKTTFWTPQRLISHHPQKSNNNARARKARTATSSHPMPSWGSQLSMLCLRMWTSKLTFCSVSQRGN